jgi:tight adherence protein B
MWLLPVVFIVILAIVLVPYAVLVIAPERRLLRKLQPSAGPSVARPTVVRPSERFSAIAPLHHALERAERLSVPVKRHIEQAGLQMTVGVWLLATGCLMLIGYLLTFIATRQFALALAVGAISGVVPYLLVRRARAKRLHAFEEQLPDAIDMLARSLRAGHALSTGLGMVADELGPPAGTEFRILYDEQNFGLALPDALRNFASRVPILDAKFLVTAILTQREAGGNLAEVLDNLSGVIRERFRVRRQIRVISTHGRLTGWVLVLFPPLLALGFLLVSPNHLQTLVRDPLGWPLIFTAVGLQILGTLIIRRIVNVEY